MELPIRFLKKPCRSHGGAHVPHHKNTAHNETYLLPTPAEVILPMSQHIGAPCTPCVAVGDSVKIGQKIAESTAFVSAPIHATVSGTVKKITQVKMPNGNAVAAVVIASDGLDTVSETVTPPALNTREELIEAIKQSGSVGLGGAGFPTFVKFNFKDNQADTLIINAAECEPYITSDHREILENSWGIMSGLYALTELMGFSRVVIGIEENKPDAIRILSEIAYSEKYDPKNRVRVMKLKTNYPQGAEKMLIHACTGRVVPIGKLPLDVGCVVLNITTLSFLANYFKTGMPLVRKRLTVDGSAVKNKQNVFVPIGTPISVVLEACGAENPRKILMGGPMMGTAVCDTSLPVLKQNNAILAFGEEEAELPGESDCINCGRCIASCPMSLSPVKIARASARGDLEALGKLNVMACIECGCCTFNCPAKRYVTQRMRVAKSLMRDSKNK